MAAHKLNMPRALGGYPCTVYYSCKGARGRVCACVCSHLMSSFSLSSEVESEVRTAAADIMSSLASSSAVAARSTGALLVAWAETVGVEAAGRQY